GLADFVLLARAVHRLDPPEHLTGSGFWRRCRRARGTAAARLLTKAIVMAAAGVMGTLMVVRHRTAGG
ncbi:MAG: hypothetical protein EBZ76_10230, partial [Synechococcaceae bacterium WB9_2_170]|nr:hypothetical protein [Synechococcaceae bacterium WB9_2_170]